MSLLLGDYEDFEMIDYDAIIDKNLDEIDKLLLKIDKQEIEEKRKSDEYKKNMDYYIYYLAFNAAYYKILFGEKLFNAITKKSKIKLINHKTHEQIRYDNINDID